MPEKKTIKIGVAVLAAVALVIGLSVGLTQNSKNTTNAMSASQGTEVVVFNFETDCPEVLGGSKGSKGGYYEPEPEPEPHYPEPEHDWEGDGYNRQ